MIWQQISRAIAQATGRPFNPGEPPGMAGGRIPGTFRLRDGDRSWFVKIHQADRIAMFEAEAEGLAALAASRTLQVPQALCTGTAGDVSYIVLPHIAFGRAGPSGWRDAGRQLAALHRCGADAFGWHRDNTIGATPQYNGWQSDWVAFWRERRLGFQLELAARNGHHGRLQGLGERLLSQLPALLDHALGPALLHGDLWSGNIAFNQDGEAVIYDPACYFGDREADLAMTELFGGFSADFYAAYQEAWPLDNGYRTRKTLYNLYHVLNHLNLFGGGYRAQAERMMQTLLAAC